MLLSVRSLPALPLRVYISTIMTARTDDYPSYRFIADTHGSSWYHSHYEAQLIDGVFGPLVVYGPTHVPFDEDLGPVLIQDCKASHWPEYFDSHG